MLNKNKKCDIRNTNLKKDNHKVEIQMEGSLKNGCAWDTCK